MPLTITCDECGRSEKYSPREHLFFSFSLDNGFVTHETLAAARAAAVAARVEERNFQDEHGDGSDGSYGTSTCFGHITERLS